jgi:hypothetical protein
MGGLQPGRQASILFDELYRKKMDNTTRRRQNLAYYLAALVSLSTFVLYVPSLQNEFVGWDDGAYVVNNPFVHSLNEALLKWAFFDFYASNWHPLTWISHALDYAIWGLNPVGHHLTNNILHALNTFLVVLLAVRLLEGWKVKAGPEGRGAFLDERGILITGVVTGLLFGIHPLHVESVAWVAERKDLLCALFFLLSIMAYVKYATTTAFNQETEFHHRGTETQRESKTQILNSPYSVPLRFCGPFPLHKYYLSALAFFILALMSKPMAVSLPAVLLILDWYPFGRIASFKTFRTSFTEKLPFIALSLASSVLTILAQKAGGSIAAITVLPFSTRMLVAAQSLISYLSKMILPLNLIPIYPYPRNVSFLSFEFLAAVFLVTGITAACAVMLRKEKLWAAVWLYYVVALIPVIGIVQVGSQPMADRYTYLPSLGPFLMAGLITAGLYGKVWTSGKGGALLKMGSIAAVSVVLALMTYTTLRQIGIWKDGITLWRYVIEKEPLKVPLAYNNGGFALMDKGRIDEAIEYFQIAIRLDPTYEKAFNNLGLAYKSKGLYDKAAEEFMTALRLKPDDPEVHNNLGVAYRYKGMYEEAIEQHRIALNLNPAYAEAHFNLGVIYLESGAFDKAREEFEAGLKIKPDDQKARQVLRNILSR